MNLGFNECLDSRLNLDFGCTYRLSGTEQPNDRPNLGYALYFRIRVLFIVTHQKLGLVNAIFKNIKLNWLSDILFILENHNF
jgi:hypothetical protein